MTVLRSLAAGLAFIALQTGFGQARAEGVALTGRVTSDAEGAMEGVAVTAKKAGSIISVSVYSDKDGRYSFPADRLEPGDYTLKIRATGYDLDGAAMAAVAGNATATADLKLKKTKNLAAQLTNREWLMSFPGNEEQKSFLLNCNGCHTYERIARSTHDADEWQQVIVRMQGYGAVSQPIKPQRMLDAERASSPDKVRKPAEYLASLNLSSVDKWEYDLKTLPRPSGKATKVVVTQYDMGRPTIEPHDVLVDDQGAVWYSNFGELFIGKFDPKTLKHTEYPLKELKAGYPVGNLDLERDKYNGTLWFDMMYQASIGNLDPKTGDVKYYPLPKDIDSVKTQMNFLGLSYAVDGKVWTKNVGTQDVYRVDLKTGAYETFQPLKELAGGPYSIYQVISDKENNLYFAEYTKNHIGRIDAKTGKVTFWETPTANSRPRRLQMDDQERLYFAEYRGNKIGMFDTKTEKFTEWPLPQPWSNPYRPAVDKDGFVWASLYNADSVARIDPKTGETVEYVMPTETNMRTAYADNSGARPALWVGSNHAHALVKVEPLE